MMILFSISASLWDTRLRRDARMAFKSHVETCLVGPVAASVDASWPTWSVVSLGRVLEVVTSTRKLAS